MFAGKSLLILTPVALFGLVLMQEAAATGRGLVSPSAGPCDGAGTCTVTCGVQTIGEVLANAASGPGGKLTILVNGDCTEDITIERDDVTLKNGTITGTGANQPVINIRAARRIIIDNMVVQGGASHGILGNHNADVRIINSTVQNNAGYGVRMQWGAFADVEGDTITGNAQCAVAGVNGGRLFLANNPVISSAVASATICATIGGYRDATIQFGGGNTITNTTAGGAVMDIIQGSTIRQQSGHDTISGDFLYVDRTANVDVRDASITVANTYVSRGGELLLRNSTITGNLTAYFTGILYFQNDGSVTVNGNVVTCGTVFNSPVFGLGGGFVPCP